MSNEQVIFLGYRVEKLPEDESKKYRPAYLLTGPRGAQYFLVRNLNNPSLLFVENRRTYKVVSLMGYDWFTDRKGYLTPVH